MDKRKAVLDICIIYILNLALMIAATNIIFLRELLQSGFWGNRLVGVLIYMILFIGIIIVVKGKDKEPLSSIGLHFHFPLKEVSVAVVVGILLFIIPLLLALAVGYDVSDIAEKMPLNQAIAGTVYYFVFVAVVEESTFRGLIFHRAKCITKSKILQYLITSLLFSFMHIISFNWMQFLSTFIFSIVMCLLFDHSKSNSIFPLIIAHGVMDSIQLWII